MLASEDFMEGCDNLRQESGAGVQEALADWPEVEGSRLAWDGATANSDSGCGRKAGAGLGGEISGTG